jgi:hypothetical protein
MIEHTHQLKQYAQVIGRKAYLYKRPAKKGVRYAHPVFVGLEWFKNKAEALQFKRDYDA